MKNIIYLFAFLTLAGCKPELKGTLSVRSAMPVIVKGQTIVVPPGAYRAEYTAGDKATFAVLKIENVNGQNLKVQLRFPAGQEAPQYYGDLNIASQASGQPFDIVGGIDTNSDNSNIMNGTQSCTYYLNEYVCRPQKDRPPVCGFESVPHTGSEPIQYYYRTTTTDAVSSFRRPGTNMELASFRGSESDSNKVVVWSGGCRPY